MIGWLLVWMLVVGSPVARAADPNPYTLPALVNRDGARTSLARIADGHRLVVVVMKGAWCLVCMGQLQRLGAMEDLLDQRETRFVGVAVEAATGAAPAGPIARDPDHAVVAGLGLWRPEVGHPMPALVLFDRCGVERARAVGRGPGQRPEPALLGVLDTLVAAPEKCEEMPETT
jgi:hypothetical protein